MELTVENNQVAIINKSIEIFRSAPEILKANQERSSKALAVGQNIIEQFGNAWNIEDEEEKLAALAIADERANKYLVNCGAALKEEKEMRAAITQMMDEFKKMFTSAENDIDKTKPNTIPLKVQNWRDQFAQESFNVRERKRKEAERIAAKAKEAIDIKADVANNYSLQYNNYLLERKQNMTKSFNAITLENFDEKETKLKAVQFNFQFVPSLEWPGTSLHTTTEVREIVENGIAEKSVEYSSNYIAEMNLLRDELIDKLPSKKAELVEHKRLVDEASAAAEDARIADEKRKEEIAKANEAERKRLEEESRIAKEKEDARLAKLKADQDAAEAAQKQREDEEAARLKEQAEEAQKQAEQKVEMEKAGGHTMVMFEQEASIAETSSTAEVRQGYEIAILHQAAYVQIFQLWFENEGKNLTIDKIGNTKLDQMKAWAEKYAQKTGTKIESKFMRYEDSFKAVNRKSTTK